MRNALTLNILCLFFLPICLSAQVEDDYPMLEAVEEVKPDNSPAPQTGLVQMNGKKGLANRTGEMMIPIEYDYLYPEQWATFMMVAKDGRWGAIDANNQAVIPLIYDTLYLLNTSVSIGTRGEPALLDTANMRLVVRKNGQYGLIDAGNHIILPFEYSKIARGPALKTDLVKDGYWGLANSMGKLLIAPAYDVALQTDYHSQQAIARKDGLYGVIDFEGKTLLPFAYENISTIGANQDFYQFGRQGKNGIIAREDFREVLPPIFDNIQYQRQGYWETSLNGKKGLLGVNFQSLLPAQYEEITIPFYGFPNFFLAQIGPKEFVVVDTTNQKVLPGVYQDVKSYLSSGFIVKNAEGKFGMLRPGGSEMIPMGYDEIRNEMSRSLFVKKDGLYAACDTSGRFATPFAISGFGTRQPGTADLPDGKMILVGLVDENLLPDYTAFDEISAFDFSYANFIVAQTIKGQKRLGFVYQFRWSAPVIFENITHIPKALERELTEKGIEMWRYAALGTTPSGKRFLLAQKGEPLELSN